MGFMGLDKDSTLRSLVDPLKLHTGKKGPGKGVYGGSAENLQAERDWGQALRMGGVDQQATGFSGLRSDTQRARTIAQEGSATFDQGNQNQLDARAQQQQQLQKFGIAANMRSHAVAKQGRLRADALADASQAGAGLLRGVADQRAGALTDNATSRAAGLIDVASQRGPSLAQLQLQQGLERSQAANMSMAGAARGGNRALAMRQAMNANSQAGLQTNQQAAQLRAVEEQRHIQNQMAAHQAAMQGTNQAFGAAGNMVTGAYQGAGQLTNQGLMGAGQLSNQSMTSGAQLYNQANQIQQAGFGNIRQGDLAHQGMGLKREMGGAGLAMQGSQGMTNAGQNVLDSGLQQSQAVNTGQLNADMGFGTQSIERQKAEDAKSGGLLGAVGGILGSIF